jgi:hypothetical protein
MESVLGVSGARLATANTMVSFLVLQSASCDTTRNIGQIGTGWLIPGRGASPRGPHEPAGAPGAPPRLKVAIQHCGVRSRTAHWVTEARSSGFG